MSLNINALLANSRVCDIEYQPNLAHDFLMMKNLTFILALFCAAPASAACFADYKAKLDDPLRLHYGVAKLSEANCKKAAASADIQKRISKDGWKLLTVISLFDDSALGSKKESAGAYFLRY